MLTLVAAGYPSAPLKTIAASINAAPLNAVVQSFWSRFTSNGWRLFLVIGTFVLVAALLGKALGKGWGLVLAFMSAFGAAWLMWYLFNAVTGSKTPLFISTPQSIGDVISLIFTSDPAGIWANIIGGILGVALLFLLMRAGVNFILSFLAGFGTWVAVMLLYATIYYPLVELPAHPGGK